MFLLRAFVRRSDRVRGSGWLDCPNCHEHTSQDVVDEMTFLCFTFYRLTPIARRRFIVCRRCGYRRRTTSEETARLETSGRPIRRAWLFPVGATPLALVIVGILFIAGHSNTVGTTLTYGSVSAAPVANVTLQLPVDYNRSTDIDVVPHTFTATNLPGTLYIRLRRIEVNQQPPQILADHLADDESVLQDAGYPSAVPTGNGRPTSVTVGGVSGLRLQFDYTHAGEDAQAVIYVFNHNGVSYTIAFQAVTKGIITTYSDIEKTIVGSVTFTTSETAAPAPSASASAQPTASSTGAASPTAAAASPTP